MVVTRDLSVVLAAPLGYQCTAAGQQFWWCRGAACTRLSARHRQARRGLLCWSVATACLTQVENRADTSCFAACALAQLSGKAAAAKVA